jgi:hypothetical protein
MIENGQNAAASSGFGVGSGVDQTAEACVENGSGAHGAGFESSVEGAVFETIVF